MRWLADFPNLISLLLAAITFSFVNLLISNAERVYQKPPTRKRNQIERLLIGCGLLFCFYWYWFEPAWMWFDLAIGILALIRGLNATVRKQYWFLHSHRHYKIHSNGVTDPTRAVILGMAQVIVALLFLGTRLYLTTRYDFLPNW